MLEKLLGEATRLTHAGKLAEATAAIQRMLHGGSSAAPARERRNDDVLDGLVREVDRQSPATPIRTRPQPGFREPVVAPRREPTRPDGGERPSRFESGSFTGTSGTRSYKLFVPASVVRPPPLVVMLHGCKQSPDDFAAGTRMNEVAEERGFLVLYPAQAPRSNSSKCWNWFMPGDQHRGAGEPELLAGMTRHIIETHGVDRSRVYVAGLSAGAAMADILSREYPELYAAAGIHSGLPQGAAHDVASAFAAMQNGGGKKKSFGSGQQPESSFTRASASASAACDADAGRAPAIVFHGDRDGTVHPRNGEHVIGAVLDGAGAPDGVAVSTRKASLGGRAVTQSVHRRAGAAVGEPSLAEHWVIHGGGHAWSGGNPAGSYTDATGPDASREMVRFFEEHPLRSA